MLMLKITNVNVNDNVQNENYTTIWSIIRPRKSLLYSYRLLFPLLLFFLSDRLFCNFLLFSCILLCNFDVSPVILRCTFLRTTHSNEWMCVVKSRPQFVWISPDGMGNFEHWCTCAELFTSSTCISNELRCFPPRLGDYFLIWFTHSMCVSYEVLPALTGGILTSVAVTWNP